VVIEELRGRVVVLDQLATYSKALGEVAQAVAAARGRRTSESGDDAATSNGGSAQSRVAKSAQQLEADFKKRYARVLLSDAVDTCAKYAVAQSTSSESVSDDDT
jgi:histone H3/H4